MSDQNREWNDMTLVNQAVRTSKNLVLAMHDVQEGELKLLVELEFYEAAYHALTAIPKSYRSEYHANYYKELTDRIFELHDRIVMLDIIRSNQQKQ